MQNIEIDRTSVVFVNLTEMDKYEGLEEGLKGGGGYIDQNGYGYEIFNFNYDDGKCYGYTPPHAKINLSRISDGKINHSAIGDYIDDIFVVFTCSRVEGRMICGFYQHARVYAEPVKHKRDTRTFDIDGKTDCAPYNIVCNAENAFLIDRDKRVKLLPHSSRNSGIGHGQHPVWYADKPARQKLKDDLLDYLEKLIPQESLNDEYKHHNHTFDESKTHVISSSQISRSQAARAECIRLKGCKCNICGFDFEKMYGKLGNGYIEVHHITPVRKLSIAEGYAGTDPQKDLIPLCSNCHSMIHRRKEPYMPAAIKALLSQ